MSATTIHDELLQASGMRAVHDVVRQSFPFVYHRCPLLRVDKIRTEGLRRSPQDLSTDADHAVLARHLGSDFRKILCFRLDFSRLIAFGDDEVRATLAIRTDDLPPRLGLDWSFGGCWQQAIDLRRDDPMKKSEQVFIEVIRSFDSVISYDNVSVNLLRVWLKTSSTDPSTWPLLIDSLDRSEFETRPL